MELYREETLYLSGQIREFQGSFYGENARNFDEVIAVHGIGCIPPPNIPNTH
ncbi:MAG: hypothetical protein RLZZ519_2279 [Bacteroidota bacterium]|jgi:hypothetical protein